MQNVVRLDNVPLQYVPERLAVMAATENGSVSRSSRDSASPSPFAGHADKPHTSISSLPDVPAPIDSTARRRRRSETQELRTKVELLGTKVSS